tara:strand:+ start:89 stop:1078 length:990 start_codon:yes stop_codon:yes gene_type:complete
VILKSYIVEQDINKIDKNISLFYGENLGLINDFKKLIIEANKNTTIIRLNEEEILKKDVILFREISNSSLFEEKKAIFIDQVSDKILNQILEIENISTDIKIYLFSGVLEKKSKLRNYFEKSKDTCSIACYEDNNITLKNIIQRKLKDFKGINMQNINLILEHSNYSRAKLNNELDKINDFFHDKVLNVEKLEDLLNLKTNDDFNKLKDAAFMGEKMNTNRLLSDTILEEDRNFFYLNSINQRLGKLLEINKSSAKNLEIAVNNLKPPVFWKDKQNVINQAKKWNKNKIKSIMKKTYDIEIKIKSNSIINKKLLIKKLLVDLCSLANAS